MKQGFPIVQRFRDDDVVSRFQIMNFFGESSNGFLQQKNVVATGNSVISIETIEGGADFIKGPVVVRIPEAEATREVLEELDRILRVHAGTEEVQVKLVGESGERLFKLQPKVKITTDLYGELKVLLGAKCLS
jgi:hypothetical protein